MRDMYVEPSYLIKAIKRALEDPRPQRHRNPGSARCDGAAAQSQTAAARGTSSRTFATIAPYTIEEAYEVADAIERDDMPALKEELGDLLFQVAFHARMAEEQGAFDFADVAQALADKMIERHPHVFSEAGDGRTADQQTVAWETLKAEKRAAKGAPSLLDDVAMALPALMRAEKLTKRAARINFDWPTPEPVLEKLEEELAELKEARASAATRSTSPKRWATSSSSWPTSPAS